MSLRFVIVPPEERIMEGTWSPNVATPAFLGVLLGTPNITALDRTRTFAGEPAVWFVKNDVSRGRVNKLAIKLLKMDHDDTCHDNFVEKVVVVSGIVEGEAWDENVRGKVL